MPSHNELIDKLVQELVSGISLEEINKRLDNIRASIGLLDIFLKLPGTGKLHKMIAIRMIARDVLGYEKETF